MNFSDPFGLMACPPCRGAEWDLRNIEREVQWQESLTPRDRIGIGIMMGVALAGGVSVMGGTSALMRLAPLAGAASRIPFEGFQKWGKEVVGWGDKASGAIKAAAEMTAEKAATLDPAKVTAAKQFYENAVATGRGGAAAPERVKLMEKIIELQK